MIKNKIYSARLLKRIKNKRHYLLSELLKNAL